MPVRVHTELWSNIGILICASSLQNLAVPPQFYSSLSIDLDDDFADPVFDDVRLTGGFKSSAFLLDKAALSIFLISCFLFPTFCLWVCIEGLGTSDR